MMWIATIPLWFLSAVFLLLGTVSVGLIFDKDASKRAVRLLVAIIAFFSMSAVFAAIAVRMVSV